MTRKSTPQAKPTEPAPIALVLIEDNRLLREGIAAMLHTQPGLRVLAASADGTGAVDKVRAAKPDLVLLDLGLEDHDSLSLVSTIRAEAPSAKVIVMGFLPTQDDVGDFVRAGASGFIMKDASFEVFVATIRAVAAGDEVLPAALTNSLFSQIARDASRGGKARVLDSVRLTERERQVIDLLAVGLSNKEIATRLSVSVHTVKSHVHNVLEKLALRSRLEVAAFFHTETGPRPSPE